MKRVFVWPLAAGLLIGSWLMAFPASVAAQTPSEGFNVITSPLPIKLTTQPGQTVSTELRIKNQGDQPENIKVGLMKFGASGDNGTPDIADLSPGDTYASWVHFSPAAFTAQPGVWVTVTMTINVPPSASLGYYLAVTFSRAAQAGESGAANLKGAVATLVLLEVKTPNEKRQMDLVSFTSQHKLYEYLPANFSVKLHNNGNIYITPAGNIFIQRGNTAISTIDFNDAGGSVLPGTNRVFTVPWDSGFPVFEDKLVDGHPVKGSNGLNEQTLKWDFSQISKFRFGKYTAKLLVVYDNGSTDVPMEASLSFWVIPWKLILVALVILALIGFGVWHLARSLIRGTRSGLQKYRHAKK